MKVMVVGSGAREHALAWKLATDPGVRELICVPGNAGTARLARSVPVEALDPGTLLALAEREHVDFTVVGPEVPLAQGLADRFAERHRPVFGPTQGAARLESSKVFAKDFMTRHGVPTARYRVCDSADAALQVLQSGVFGFPVVLKADGLAAGKGVSVAPDRASAEQAITAAMVERRFGQAGTRLLLEECLLGEEVSFFAICDGQHALPLVSAQDHKRVLDGDRGPNTGGMGAFAPSPLFNPALEARVMREIVSPVLEGLRVEGLEYRGFLYVGLMITADGPQVIEFNVRMGDPEAQVVLPMIDTQLLPLLVSAASGTLRVNTCPFRKEPHVGVVIASRGYPGKYQTGVPIDGLDDLEHLPDILVFHAGTSIRDGRVVTAGGRVLTVVGRGPDYPSAIARAYDGVARIRFDGQYARSDIGQKALGLPSVARGSEGEASA